MADKLADFVVGIGVKGQNVALTEINKVKKAGAALAKQKPKVNFQNVRAEINARKQLDLIRRQTQATRGRTELAKIESQKMAQMSQRVQGAGQVGLGLAGGAMTGGVSALASQVPLLGSLFASSQSAIESAAQEYVAGVTASKNIQLIKANYSRAFSGALGTGMQQAINNGMFSDRAAKAFYTGLVDQGVNAKTAVSAAPALDTLARAQGVGSIDELMGRLQSGALKESAGLTKADIVLLQSQSQLLNNRFTADIGMQMIMQTLQRVMPQMQKIADAAPMRKLSRAVGKEGDIKESEETFSSGAESAYAGSLATSQKDRKLDRKLRAKSLKLATGVSNFKRNAVDSMERGYDNIKKYGLFEGVKKTYEQEAADTEAAGGTGGRLFGSGETGGGGELPGKRMYRSDENAESVGPLSMGSINDDMARSGQAIADTLRQINNQLNVTKAQLRRV